MWECSGRHLVGSQPVATWVAHLIATTWDPKRELLSPFMSEETEPHKAWVTCRESHNFKVAGFMLDLSQSETNVLDSIPYAFPISQLIAGETQHDWKCVNKEGNLAILDASLRIWLVLQISIPDPSMCEWRGHMIVGRLDFSQGSTLGSFSSRH